MIIEADLADGARRRCGRELRANDIGRTRRVVGELVRGVGMHANAETNVRPKRFEARGLRGLVRIAGGQNYQSTLDAGVARAADNLVEVCSEGFIGQVTV